MAGPSTILGFFQSFVPGFRLIDGGDLLQQANLLFSSMTGLVATSGGTQAAALPLTAAVNEVTTVAADTDSVMLPLGLPGRSVAVVNSGGHSLQVFGVVTNPQNAGTGDTIIPHDSDSAAATATGVAQADTVYAIYTCVRLGVWKQGLLA